MFCVWCMRMCIRGSYRTSQCMHVEAKSQCCLFSSAAFLLSFELPSLTESGTCCFSYIGWLVSLQDPPILAPQHPDDKYVVLCPEVLRRCWDVSWGPHICTASRLFTELFSKPLFLFHFFFPFCCWWQCCLEDPTEALGEDSSGSSWSWLFLPLVSVSILGELGEPHKAPWRGGGDKRDSQGRVIRQTSRFQEAQLLELS